jgi:hypothetical protein
MFESLTDLKGAHVYETSQPVNYWSWQKYLSPARNLLDRKGSSQHADRRRFAAALPQKRSQLVIDIVRRRIICESFSAIYEWWRISLCSTKAAHRKFCGGKNLQAYAKRLPCMLEWRQ